LRFRFWCCQADRHAWLLIPTMILRLPSSWALSLKKTILPRCSPLAFFISCVLSASLQG
jgi:hypothetical protein